MKKKQLKKKIAELKEENKVRQFQYFWQKLKANDWKLSAREHMKDNRRSSQAYREIIEEQGVRINKLEKKLKKRE